MNELEEGLTETYKFKGPVIEYLLQRLQDSNGNSTPSEKAETYRQIKLYVDSLPRGHWDILALLIEERLGISKKTFLKEAEEKLREARKDIQPDIAPKKRYRIGKEPAVDNTSSCEPTGPVPTYQEVEAKFREYFCMEDSTALKVSLATVAVNRADGDPLWLLIVGPPSSLKTEIIRSLSHVPGIHPMSSLTPKTFASGDPKDKKASLLLRLPSNPILTLKDFGSVLSMQRDSRQELMGQLRELYDGEFQKEFGNGIRISWKGKLGLIAGVTDIIETYHSVHQTLGERFLFLRTEIEDRQEAGRRALQHKGFELGIRHDITKTVSAFFSAPHLQKPQTPTFTEWEDKLVALADFITQARTGIIRDGYSREVEFVPGLEGPSRLVKQFASLLMGLAVIHGRENPTREDYAIVYSVAIDTLPRSRARVLTLVNQEEGLTPGAIQERLERPLRYVERTLEELKILKVVKSQGGVYFLTNPTRTLLERACPE